MQLVKIGRSKVGRVLVMAGLAMLSGLAGPAPAQDVPNDNCAGAWPLGLGQTSGTNEGSTNSAGSVSCAPIGADVWYSLVTPTAGLLTISTVPGPSTVGPGDQGTTQPIDSVLTVYSGSCGNLVQLACNDDASFTLQSEVKFFVAAGESLLVRVGGFSGDTGGFVLTVGVQDVTPTGNDDCSGAVLVTTPTISGTNQSAFSDTDSGSCSVAGKNVWYAYAAPSSGKVTASLLHNGGSADFDTVLAVYTGSCGALQPVACNDDFSFSSGQWESEVSFTASSGALYFLSVGGYHGDSGSFTLSLEHDPEAGGLFVHPLDGHVFTLGPAGMTWSQARDYAQAIGGHLATFGSFLDAFFVQLNYTGVTTPLWLGLSDEGHEGSYTWVTGESLNFLNWQAGQPDNNCSGAAENCVAMIPSTGGWVDSTDSGCTLGPVRALIEFDGPIPMASTTSVGEGCAAGTLPALLGGPAVLGSPMTLSVLDPGEVSFGVILASPIPAGTTTVGRCTIQIDLSATVLAGEIVTDAFGFATIAVPVPPDPAIVGIGFAVQSFLVRASDHSWAATNGLHAVVGF